MADRTWVERVLGRVESVGNRLPDPVTLFAIFCAGVALVSAVFAGADAEVMQRDGAAKPVAVVSLLSAEGIRWAFTSAVKNFTDFAPLGAVLTVLLGIGVAERTGMVTMGLRLFVARVPARLLTPALVFACVMSSMVADAGYVVLTPLGAVLFAGMGRHPLAGLAAAYAGVSGGFSANLAITSLDPMLARLTDAAAKTIDPAASVNATANWYFMVASVFLVTAVGTWVTERIVEPSLGPWDPSRASEPVSSPEAPSGSERRAFRDAVAAAAVATLLVAALGVWGGSPLRVEPPEGAPAIASLDPFFHSIEVLIAALFLVPGVVYGVRLGTITSDKDVARLMSDTMATMGPYIVLAFTAGQFVAWFNWTNLGTVGAVRGAALLQQVGLTGVPLLLLFLLASGTMNLLVGSASAKWAFMAPIFVPMLMLSGISPEVTQATYRVGDSVTNVVSPLLPYLPIVIVFAQRYDKKAGLGTILSAMLPYSVALGVAWTVMLVAWVLLGLPFGPGTGAGLGG